MGTSLSNFDEERALLPNLTPETRELSTMPEYVGTYNQTNNENYEEFLKALDVSFLLRKAATASTPVMTVTFENDTYTFKTATMMKSMELKFKLDKEFEETTADGREVKAIVKKEGHKSTKVTRTFFDDRVEVKMEVLGTDVVCNQV